MISQELTLKTSQFEAALERVTKLVEAKSQRMQRSFRGSGSGAGGIMGGLGSGAAGLGRDLVGMAGLGSASAALVTLGTTVKSSLSWADDLSDLTLKLNESAESLQKVNFAANLAGAGGVEEIANSFIKLERALGDVENEKAAKALANLGLTAGQLAAMSLDEKILALSDAFQKARASGTGVADIQALLGKSSAELIPLLEQGSEALRNLFEEAPVLAESTVQEMARINDEFDKLILKAKSFTAEGVGMVARTGQFLLDAAGNMVLGDGLIESLDQATGNLINKEIAANLAANERNQSRKDQGQVQAEAAERAKQDAERAKQDAELERFAQEEAKASAELGKFRDERNAAAKKDRQEYQAARFETLTPEQQMEVMLDKIERATGKRTADESFIASAADVTAQLGDFQSATNLLGMLATVRGITSRIGGMDRAQAGEQGSMANLMDKIFGRENRELEAIAKNTNASKGTLDQIYQNLLQPPPRDTFDDY